jgi:hypothetical protein
MNNSFEAVVDASAGIKQFISDPLSPELNRLFSYLENPQNRVIYS